MKFGWPISLVLHAGVCVSGMIAFSSGTLDADKHWRVVPVELLTVDELTNIRAAVHRPDSDTPPDQLMTLETPMVFAPAEGASRRVDSAPEPTLPDVTDLLNDQQTDEVLPDRPEPETPVFNLDDMAALIDRTRETQEKANQQNVTRSA
ncbi:MAG: hypothetical protein GDA39_03825, partial [Hyphomonadaceae bacterium]|nr:hypothetical protein [Hyphomonadaceae bacterium]